MLKINKDIQIGDTGRTLEMLGETVAETLPVGTIAPYGGAVNQVPQNWLPCDGREVSRLEYAKLFSIIGTRFGEGDGSTTFELPDLQGKVPVGQDVNDAAFDVLGETGGEKEHTLTVNEIPSHKHKVPIQSYINTDAQTNYPNGGHVNSSSAGVNYDTTSTGGGQAHNNLQPYQVTLYIIKAFDQQLGNLRSESLPVGSEIDFDGSEIPEGWEAVGRKTNPYIIKEQTENIIHYTNTSSWSCIPLTTDVKTYGDFSSWSFPTGGTNINRVVVGNNASKIRITVDIAVRGDNCSGWCMLGLYKGTNTSNEVQMKKTITHIPNGGWGNLHLDYILDVSENDLISIKIMKDVAGTFDISSLTTSFGDAPLNTLTIEILED